MKIIKTILFFILLISNIKAQDSTKLHFLDPAPHYNPTRFWSLTTAGALTYTGASIGLYQVWYKGYPQSSFHLFNDLGEWQHMDKTGHFITPYHEARAGFEAGLWSGLSRKKSAWIGVGAGMLFQTTIEMMDGFSSKWGFSWPDMAYNSAGCLLFLGQELLWHEQRIMPKVSSTKRPYPTTFVTSTDGLESVRLVDRAHSLYGTSAAAVFLKDYNALNAWVSVNVSSFLPKENKFPKWLNIAVGYGADNLYAGYDNKWVDEQTGRTFIVDPVAYPVYRQFYLSPDIDWMRIPTRHRFLRALFKILNVVKIPAPALEYNTLGQWKFHPIFF